MNSMDDSQVGKQNQVIGGLPNQGSQSSGQGVTPIQSRQQQTIQPQVQPNVVTQPQVQNDQTKIQQAEVSEKLQRVTGQQVQDQVQSPLVGQVTSQPHQQPVQSAQVQSSSQDMNVQQQTQKPQATPNVNVQEPTQSAQTPQQSNSQRQAIKLIQQRKTPQQRSQPVGSSDQQQMQPLNQQVQLDPAQQSGLTDQQMEPRLDQQVTSQVDAQAQPAQDATPTNQVDEQAQVQPVADQPVQRPRASVGRPSGAKEAEFISGGPTPTEHVPVIEIREPGELPIEVEGWIERAQHDDVPEMKPIIHKGKTYAIPAAPQQVKVTLPLDQEGIKKGLHHKIADSFRWLAEWCTYLVDKYKGQVGYKKRE